MTLTLRQLEYLVAIQDEGSFNAAARACYVTQPGLSSQIRQLEEGLGVRLFERDRRKVLATAAGRELVERARAILTSVADLVEAAERYDQPLTGRLRLGVIPTVSPYLLPRVLPAVRKRYPKLTFQLHEGQTADLLEALQRGDLDLLLLALEAPLGKVETHTLFRDSFLVAVPSSHRFAKRKSLNEEDLAEEAMLLLEDGHCLRDQALMVCGRAGVEESSDFRASSLPTLMQMVAGGSGITLLPELAIRVEGKARGISLIPMRKNAPYRSIGLAWRPSSARASEFKLLGDLLMP